MEDRKTLFDLIKEVCDENDYLHEQNNWLLKERNELREEIDNKDEIIQSLHDEIEARSAFTKKVIKERDDFCDEMKLMVKDHEVECEDYIAMLKEKVDINDLHLIFSEYIDGKYKPSSVPIMLFQIMDKIKEYIDSNKKEC